MPDLTIPNPAAVEYGTCDICGNVGPVQRIFFQYDLLCECCPSKHFEILRHCPTCQPKEPTFTTLRIRTDKLKEMIAYTQARPRGCPNCHRGCFDIDRFCPHCGTKLPANP